MGGKKKRVFQQLVWGKEWALLGNRGACPAAKNFYYVTQIAQGPRKGTGASTAGR